MFRGHQLAVLAVAVLDDSHIVTGSLDNTARVWDVRTGQEIAPPLEHQAAVTSVAVTPDRTAMITGSRDGGVRIWNAATHAKVAEFKAHDRFVTAIALAATEDGPRIITGSSDGTARLWHLLPVGQALIDQAKASVVRCLSPAQRVRYYLPQMQPRWCGGEGKYPYNSVSALIEGRRLLVGGKVDEASALFKEQLGRSSGSAVNDAWAKAYIELGRNHLRAQRNPDAEAMFAEALKRDPSSNGRIDAEWVDAFIARGSTLLRERKDDEASRPFADAVKRNPSASTRIEAEWATAFFVRGKDLLVEGKVDEAKSVFAEALKHDPSAASRINTAWVPPTSLSDQSWCGKRKMTRRTSHSPGRCARILRGKQTPVPNGRSYIGRGREFS